MESTKERVEIATRPFELERFLQAVKPRERERLIFADGKTHVEDAAYALDGRGD